MTKLITKKALGMAVILGLCAVVFVAVGAVPAHAQTAYGTPIAGTYSYNSSYPTYTYPASYPYPSPYPYYPSYPSLSVTCSANASYVNGGTGVTWTAYASGGNGYYSYSWSGDEGLSGSNASVYKIYYYAGPKNASVTVYSNGQSVTQYCGTVNVNSGYYNNGNYPYYPYPSPYYPSLSVTCSPNTNYTSVGQPVTWTAYASGGNGYFSYNWSGSEYISNASGQTATIAYQSPGSKVAQVTVTSNGQSVTQSCSSVVNVAYTYGNYGSYTYGNSYSNTYSYPANYQTYNYNGLDIGCFADPSTATVNQPVTWTVEVTGGAQPYTYSWTGTDGLTGAATNVIKYYSSAGTKNAIVTVTSADGKTASHACSNQVTVKRASTGYVAAPRPVQTVNVQAAASSTAPVANVTSPTQAAASYFSLGNVPWGWVAILVILILFATVLYLLFNRDKI